MQPIFAEIALAVAAGLFGAGVGLLIFALWTGRLRIVTGLAQVPPAQPAAPEPTSEQLVLAETVKTEVLTVHEWTAWNPWYHADPVLALEAQSVHVALRRDKPEQPLEENLAEVTAEMRRRHPSLMIPN